MPNVKGMVKAGPGFENEARWVTAVYDFSVDGGAIGTYNLVEVDKDCAVIDWYLAVEEGVTSAGAATLSAGYTGATSHFASAIAKADLTANSLHKYNAFGDVPVRVTSGSYLTIDIEAAALTAGKITLHACIRGTYSGD